MDILCPVESIKINKRKIVITANDNTVPYDGKPHGGNGYTVSGISGEENSGLVTGHEVKNVVISGEQTEEGTYENALVPSGAQIFEGNSLPNHQQLLSIVRNSQQL